MSSGPLPSEELIEDTRSALDRIRGCAIDLRHALLKHFRGWLEDRVLGPPFSLGLEERPDGLERHIGRVVAAGGASRHLEDVQHKMADLDHCALSYTKGHASNLNVASWRETVERVFGAYSAALDAADNWLTRWAQSVKRRQPHLELLDQLELLDTHQLAEVLGVGEEQAARRRRSGEFDQVIGGGGGRKYVRSDNVRKALGMA